jgi:hypothetical protein
MKTKSWIRWRKGFNVVWNTSTTGRSVLIYLLKLCLSICILTCIFHGQTIAQDFQIADFTNLKTWWQYEGVWNSKAPVADDEVRRSSYYHVQVSTSDAPDNYYDSFTYISIPRNGRAKWGYTYDDGADQAVADRASMSWSTFLFKTGVWVEVTFFNQYFSRVDEIVLRPTNLNLHKELVAPNKFKFFLPYRDAGYRVSVENTKDMRTISSSYNQQEPRNGLMIFAKPNIQTADVVPDTSQSNIYYPSTGVVSDLSSVDKEIIYFRPGVYSMPWNYHATLPANVKWIYLAPGAYVKGAFEESPDTPGTYRITGYGVLSGENYVAEADTENGYQHRSASTEYCFATCVSMLKVHGGTGGIDVLIHGITIANQPYHLYHNFGYEYVPLDIKYVDVLGGWFWMTGGFDLFPGSTMSHSFFHTNDDAIIIWRSDVQVDDITVWQPPNGGVIQFGWVPREINNVSLSNIDVIHNRFSWDHVHNGGVINSARYWAFESRDDSSTGYGDTSQTVQNITIDNLRVEDKIPYVFRVYAQSNLSNMLIRNLWVESWTNSVLDNTLRAEKDENNVAVTVENVSFDNFYVGNQKVSKQDGTWSSVGNLNFDSDLWWGWDAF